MRRQQQCGPEYEVVLPRKEDLTRDERPLLSAEVGTPPLAPGPTPSLPEPESSPEVETPTERGALSREIKKELVTKELKVPPVKLHSPPVSAPPPLERGQRTRQPPAYLQDFICDCVQSGKYVSSAGCYTGKPSVNCGSCTLAGESESYLYEGGVVGGINRPKAKSPSHVQRTCCSAFSYADITKGRRVLQSSTQQT